MRFVIVYFAIQSQLKADNNVVSLENAWRSRAFGVEMGQKLDSTRPLPSKNTLIKQLINPVSTRSFTITKQEQAIPYHSSILSIRPTLTIQPTQNSSYDCPTFRSTIFRRYNPITIDCRTKAKEATATMRKKKQNLWTAERTKRRGDM